MWTITSTKVTYIKGHYLMCHNKYATPYIQISPTMKKQLKCFIYSVKVVCLYTYGSFMSEIF